MEKAFRILVVEDDPDLGTMIKLLLEHKGFGVTLTASIEQTKEILSNNNIDLILMDMLLSGANGIDICAALKNNNKTKAIPVMMISAHPNAMELCMEAGADDFIPKPFDMQDLLVKVNSLIKENRKAK